MGETIQLGDLITIQRGITYKSDLLGHRGPALLGLGTIRRHGGFKKENLKTYGGDSPEKILVQPGEMYASLKDVTQTADVLGAVAKIPEDGPIGRLTQDTVRIDLVSDQISLDYLYWVLRTPQYRKYCRNHATGTTTMGLSREDFFAFGVPEPSASRVALVQLLGALDDKIAANDKVITKAAELATLTWIDACESGSSVPLSSLARFVNGKAFTRNASGTGRVVIRIAELNSGLGGSTVYNDIEVADDHTARPGDLLFAWSGSLTVARWYRDEAIINQHIFKVVPTIGNPIWLVDQALRSKLREFKAIAADKATTMGHIQRRHLDEPVTMPSEGMVRRIDGGMTVLWDRALAAEQETLSLAATRDELLPLLMSGKVRVRDAEKIVEEVT